MSPLTALDEAGRREYFQAGRSVAGISAIEPAAGIVRRFDAAWRGVAAP